MRYLRRLRSPLQLVFITLGLGLLLSPRPGLAQKVALKDDQITVDGKPYGRLLRVGRSAIKDFSLRTLQDAEVFYAKARVVGTEPNESVYYTLTFLPSGQQVVMQRQTLNFGRTLAELAVDNQLIGPDGQPSPAGEQRFVKVFGGQQPEVNVNVAVAVPGPAAPDPARARRNRQLPLFLQGDEVVQDGQTIAEIEAKDVATEGIIVRQLQIERPDDVTPIAVATFRGLGATECRVVTLKDNKVHVLPLRATDPNAGLEVVRYLTERYYL